jgi:hypothetical protein
VNDKGISSVLEITDSVLKRIANIYNSVVSEAMVTLSYRCLTHAVEHPDGSLAMWVKICEAPPTKEPLWPVEASEPVYMAAMSFSHCVKAISMCSGILAYLTKGVCVP